MSNKSHWGRQVDKSQLLGQKSKLGQFEQSNSLTTNTPRTRQYKLEKGSVTASFRIISGSEVKTITKAHPLNPRNQEALDGKSVSTTLESIRENGIDTDCLGIWSDDEKTILVIEGSVRRYCAIETAQPYPIWVLPANSATNKDIRRLIKDASDKKPHSLRERGESYWKEAQELSSEPESLSNTQLAELLGIGRETLRKALQAYKLDIRLIKLFPDYEGMPNSIYPSLSKVEKMLEKAKVDVNDFIETVTSNQEFMDAQNLEGIDKAQQDILSVVVRLATQKPEKKNEWATADLATFSERNKSAKISVSADGRKHKFEFARIDKSVINEIEAFIKQKLAPQEK